MAGIKDKLIKENSSQRVIRFYREGVFLVAYEQSAYLFHRFVRQYKVIRKTVKEMAADVVSIAFPRTIVISLFEGRICEEDNGTFVVALLDDELYTDVEYAEWRERVPLTVPTSRVEKPQSSKGVDDNVDIIERIREFPLDNRTPIECMVFLSELKRSLHCKSRE